jgi:hypothetical protein
MRYRLLVISVLVALGVLGGARWTAAATTNFDVINNAMTAWTINGTDNPTLTLTQGQTYVFNNRATGHPFWITTARGAASASANAFSAGVSGNGSTPGTITFVVPASAPATLFYQCGVHNAMGGTLNIVAPPPVPFGGQAVLVLLVALLLVIAVATLRKWRVVPG